MKTPLRLRLLVALIVFGLVALIAYVFFTSASGLYPSNLSEMLILSFYGLVPSLPAAALCYWAFSTTSPFHLLVTLGVLLFSCLTSAYLGYAFGTLAGGC